jgi:hypothetical protein
MEKIYDVGCDGSLSPVCEVSALTVLRNCLNEALKPVVREADQRNFIVEMMIHSLPESVRGPLMVLAEDLFDCWGGWLPEEREAFERGRACYELLYRKLTEEPGVPHVMTNEEEKLLREPLTAGPDFPEEWIEDARERGERHQRTLAKLAEIQATFEKCARSEIAGEGKFGTKAKKKLKLKIAL